MVNYAPGVKYKIESVSDSYSVIAQHLTRLGLVKGVKFTVVRAAPLGDPIEVLLRGYHLTLRKNEAKEIFVREKL